MASRYSQLITLIDRHKPKSIIEIGTHRARRAVMMCERALLYGPVHYTGYDLFEDSNPQTDAIEMNGKGGGNITTAHQRLEKLKMDKPDFSYVLIKGNTRDTLHGDNVVADFV